MTRRTRVAIQLMELSIVLVISWLGSNLWAQELVGTIAGQLIDQTDSALPGAHEPADRPSYHGRD